MAFTTSNMGLKVWDLLTDPFSHTELQANWTAVDAHDHSTGKGVQIPTAGITNLAVTGTKIADGAIITTKLADASVTTAKLIDANVTADKLADTAKLGLTSSSGTRRGKSIIATTESRTNTSYGLMTTPDRVSGIVLPTDGFIVVMYQATWQESVKNAARVSLFLGASQVKAQASFSGPSGQGPAVVEAAINLPSTLNIDVPLFSTPVGLMSMDPGAAGGIAADVATGQVVGGIAPDAAVTYSSGTPAVISAGTAGGGPTYIFATAGTYDISVQFKASSGSVTVKNRKLWVWTIGF
jgi:hypothetical protein